MKKLLYIGLSLIALLGLAYFIKNKYSVNPPLTSANTLANGKLPLDKLKMPEGFKINVYANDVSDARSMCLSPSGTLFIGNKEKSSVYALVDENHDNVAEKKYTVYTGGNLPMGVAFKDGSLYIAEVNRIIRLDNIEANLATPPSPVVVYDKFPTEKHHGTKYINFGPDGKLYVPVGAPCNICNPEDSIFASITRMNPDGSGLEIVAKGVRNTVGFTWHPDTKQLWFTDNNRDMMGDDIPSCELNKISKSKEHFGYPFCHQGDILDPEFGKNKKCEDYTKPVAKVGAHVAPLGIEFYRNNGGFPAAYQNKFFIAKHGSWNRKEKAGYDISMIEVDSLGNLVSQAPFISGWLSDDKKSVWGRPVDLEIMPDGSMLISDDFANCIYRVTYEK
jgi:glucose/arabinose dehydrogenase